MYETWTEQRSYEVGANYKTILKINETHHCVAYNAHSLYKMTNGLRTPNEAFFHQNHKLSILGTFKTTWTGKF